MNLRDRHMFILNPPVWNQLISFSSFFFFSSFLPVFLFSSSSLYHSPFSGLCFMEEEINNWAIYTFKNIVSFVNKYNLQLTYNVSFELFLCYCWRYYWCCQRLFFSFSLICCEGKLLLNSTTFIHSITKLCDMVSFLDLLKMCLIWVQILCLLCSLFISFVCFLVIIVILVAT